MKVWWTSPASDSRVEYGLEQNVIDTAIDQWRRRLTACIRERGGHFEHRLWTREEIREHAVTCRPTKW